MRRTGLNCIGNLRWGSHFGLFYRDASDLLDVLVPYFQCGLQDNEFCLWVVCGPLSCRQAAEALRCAVPDLEQRIRRGQMEIIDGSACYAAPGGFVAEPVLRMWMGKEATALDRGFEGFRLSGNVHGLHAADWDAFMGYESQVDQTLQGRRILAACGYSQQECGPSEIIDVVSHHAFALSKRGGAWRKTENEAYQNVHAALVQSERLARQRLAELESIYASAPVGLSVMDTDLRWIRINQKLAEMNGFTPAEHLGRSVRELLPNLTEQAEAMLRGILETGRPVLDMEITGETPAQPGVQRVWRESFLPLRDADGKISHLSVVCEEITERKRAEVELQRSEQFERAILDSLPAHIAVLNGRGDVVAVNKPWQRFAVENGCPKEDRVSVGANYLAVCRRAVAGQDAKAGEALAGIEAVLSGRQKRFVMEYPCNSPEEDRWFLMNAASLPEHMGGAIVSHLDITARRQKEQELHRLNRTLKAISDSDHAMMRIVDEADYLKEVCRIIVEDCGHAMVWGGYAEDDEAKTVRPVAHAGDDDGYLKLLNVTWADTERGRGPTGAAIRTGKPSNCANMQTDPRFAPWLKEAAKRGYASSLALPLIAEGKVFGSLTIYSKQPDAFSAEEMRLLMGLADDLAYGITTIRLRQAHMRAEEALRESEQRYRSLFNGMSEGFALHEIICNDRGEPCDYRFLDINPVFEDLTGLKRQSILGKTMTSVLPSEDPHWIKAYGQVALTGQPVHFEHYSPAFKRHYEVFAYCPKLGQFAVVFTDVTERKRIVEQLHQAKAAAEEANQAKDHFIAVLSHELRTPLTPVLTTLQMMEKDDRLPVEDRESLSMVRRNVELETRLIDDLLDLTRISRGKVELHLSIVNLHETLRHAIQICDSDIRSKQLKLILQRKARDHHVQGDAARLQQILWNLLKNAIKFTPSGGTISLRTENRTPGRISVTIADSGVGIEPDRLACIFDAFEQGGKHVTRMFGGLGLGLAICKGLVNLHGGTLAADSEGPNTGAVFTLELSCTMAVEPVVPLSNRSDAQSSGHKGRRILLVEDHPDTAQAMVRLLKRQGYEVRPTDSVAGALQAAEAEPFDLLISDIGLPDGSGLDVIRQLSLKRAIKGIALSGYGMEEDVQKSREAGFAAHLTKPVDVELLIKTLRGL